MERIQEPTIQPDITDSVITQEFRPADDQMPGHIDDNLSELQRNSLRRQIMEQNMGLSFVPLLNVHPIHSGAENICFANSTVQMLLGSSEVRYWLLIDEYTEFESMETELDRIRIEGRHIMKRELNQLATASYSGNATTQNVRLIRDAVSKYSLAEHRTNFSDYQQHCAVEFLEEVLAMADDRLRKLFQFDVVTTKKCRFCPEQETDTVRTSNECVLRLHLHDRDHPQGIVTLQELIDTDGHSITNVRCAQCCPDERRLVHGQWENNPGVPHNINRRIELSPDQQMLLVMLNPFDYEGGQDTRTKRTLVGLFPDTVHIGGREWCLIAGVEFIGETIHQGHYESWTRLEPAKWRRGSDTQHWDVSTPPFSKLYTMLFQQVI